MSRTFPPLSPEGTLNVEGRLWDLERRVDLLSRGAAEATGIFESVTNQTVTTGETDFINHVVTVPGWVSVADLLLFADLGASESTSQQNYTLRMDTASGGAGSGVAGSTVTIANGTTNHVWVANRAEFGPGKSYALGSTITIDVSALTNDHSQTGCQIRLWGLAFFRGSS